MKNIKGFNSFINESLRILPKELAEGFAYTEDGKEIRCSLGEGKGFIYLSGFVPQQEEGNYEVGKARQNSPSMIIKDKTTQKTFTKIEEAVKYANELVKSQM